MSSFSQQTDRLDFTLPDFTRISWVSEAARRVWEPRIAGITRAWWEIEWLSVVAGIRSCCLTVLPPEALVPAASRWAKKGLASLPLQIVGRPNKSYVSASCAPRQGEPIAFRVVGGEWDAVFRFERAWRSNDHEALGALLGYPSCCREFFCKIWIEAGNVDTTWAMATNSSHIERGERSISVRGSPIGNILWRWMGVRSVPHLPCRFDCSPTKTLGGQFQDIGIRGGFRREIAWIQEILSWPVEWTALHGIAEVKTPVLRVSTRTDATAKQFIVRYKGESFPEEGAKGLGFAYRTPKRLTITDSTGFRRGIENDIRVSRAMPEWYHLDNGFSSRYGMDAAHHPIIQLAEEELSDAEGNIIDLGCGNGALLKKIVSAQSMLVPHGVDVKPECILHAKELLPEHAGNFVCRDFFDNDTCFLAARYVIGILMIGRLLEVRQEKRERFLSVLRSRCHRLLVYVYPGYSPNNIGSLVEQTGCHLLKTNGEAAGIVDIK
jgi:2-polyprenyl-3-methyl-5-hydroxy-6-metoxy-1,4-benzoquinol methylase